MLNDIPDAAVSDKTVTWTVSGSSNGNAAQLVYTIDGGSPQTIVLTGVGGFSESISATTNDFAQTVTLNVRLVDSDPGGRGEARKSKSSISGTPVPGVGVSKRLVCRDDDTEKANDCWQGPGKDKPPPCEVNSCGFISFSAQGFYESFTCSVAMTWDDAFGYAGWQTYSFGPTGSGAISQDTDWYAPSGGGATVTCQGSGLFGRTASGSQPW